MDSNLKPICLRTTSRSSRRRAIAAIVQTALGSVATAVTLSPADAGASGAGHGGRGKPRSHKVNRMLHAGATVFVLVHGGWHGGWCWSRVAPLLQAAGHHVWAPTLTGLADRAHLLTPETGLDTHIDDVAGLLAYEELEHVVLVGHSYAGMVIAGAAAREPERVSRLVYLDAFVPVAGDSVLRLLPAERAEFYRSAAERGEGWRVPPPPTAALGVTDEEDSAWLESKLTDHPLLSFEQPLPETPPASLPRTYIHCTVGPVAGSFAPFAARAQSEPGWSYHEVATGHDAMITAPETLSDLLLGLSREDA